MSKQCLLVPVLHMFGLVAAGSGVDDGYGHLAVGPIHRIEVLSGYQAITAITMVIVSM